MFKMMISVVLYTNKKDKLSVGREGINKLRQSETDNETNRQWIF